MVAHSFQCRARSPPTFWLPRSWACQACAVVTLLIVLLQLTWSIWWVIWRIILANATERHVRMQPIRGELRHSCKYDVMTSYWENPLWTDQHLITFQVRNILSFVLKLYCDQWKNTFWAYGIFFCSTLSGHRKKRHSPWCPVQYLILTLHPCPFFKGSASLSDPPVQDKRWQKMCDPPRSTSSLWTS